MTKMQKITKATKDNPLVACFVIDAITKQAQAVQECDEGDWPQGHIITLNAWKNIAALILEITEEKA